MQTSSEGIAMRSGSRALRSPYKFLDSYTFADHEIFYGREQETQTLVSDIISSRIVVLFAKTGTGKTSLINAGVRPRLEDLDYATFYIRVEKDPVESVRRALRAEQLLPGSLDERPLPKQLLGASDKLQKPIVIFYDQFEEFFIYLAGSDEKRVAQFIDHVAELYRNREAAVHSVFSMREEYFVEMDAFRDEIPSIFHNDSSVRLRPFDEQQASRAIAEPARTLGVELDDTLAERIAHDLVEAGRVEPVRLQVVCDTLWHAGGGIRMQLADYEHLGGAARIVAQRLNEEIGRLDNAQLRLLDRLLPELRTERGTKYLRGINELADRLNTDLTALKVLLKRLQDGHLVKESTIHRARYVEWTSDYLAERTNYLRTRARATLYLRLLDKAVSEASGTDDLSLARAGWRVDEQARPGAISEEDFNGLSREVSEVGQLTREQGAIAFGMALAHGIQARQWFELAVRKAVDVWEILEQVLHEPFSTRPAENAIQLLGELAYEPRAMALLEVSLDDQVLAQRAFQTLSQTRSQTAVDLLERAVEDESRAGQAIEALRRMETASAIEALLRIVRRRDAVGLRAGVALNTLGRNPHGGVAAEQARTVLQSETPALFVASLRHGVQTRFWFERARDDGIDVWEILRASITDSGVPTQQAQAALKLLRELPDQQASELLQFAAQQGQLTTEASHALEDRGKLERVREEAARREARPLRATHRGGLEESTWALLLRRIARGECVPILGNGAVAGILPLKSDLAVRWAEEYRYPLHEVKDLSRVAQFLAVRHDAMFPKEALVQELRQERAPDFSRRDDVHGTLARLPLSTYVTTNYDDLLLHALQVEGRAARLEIPRWRSGVEPSNLAADRGFESTAANPIVLHLYGHLSVPESIVLSEDDYLDFLVAISREARQLPHQIVRALARSSRLFIGYSLGEWDFQVMYRGLMAAGEASLRRLSVAVQISPEDASMRHYFEDYFGAMSVSVYWGTPTDFASELSERWQTWIYDGRE